MVRKVGITYSRLLCIDYLVSIRCNASHENLDAPSLRRTRHWTNVLTDSLDLGTLWDDYGIVGDIFVSCISAT